MWKIKKLMNLLKLWWEWKVVVMSLEVAQVPTWKRCLIDNMGVGDKSHE